MDFDLLHHTTIFRAAQYNATLSLFKMLAPLLSASVLFVLCVSPAGVSLLWYLLLLVTMGVMYVVYFRSLEEQLIPLVLKKPALAAFFAAFNNLAPLNLELVRQPESVFWQRSKAYWKQKYAQTTPSTDQCLRHIAEQLLIDSILEPATH
jgi:hypothetical protein